MGAEHQNIINAILLGQPKHVRLFQSRAGLAWQGESVVKGNLRIIKNAIPFYGMPDGWPDLCGWTTKEITSDMVGQKIAVFTAIEVKTGKQTLKKDQKMFKNLIEKMGGIFEIFTKKT